MKALLYAIVALTLMIQALPANGAQPPSPAEAKKLHELFEAEWEYGLADNPEGATYLGDTRWNDRWRDESLAAYAAREKHDRETLDRLARIDRSKLSESDQLNYDLFQKDLQNQITEYGFRTYLLPMTQRGGVHTNAEITELLLFRTVKDYEDWCARLESYPKLVDQTIELMREGIRTRILWPKVVLNRVPGQFDKVIVASPEDSRYFGPFKRFPDEIAQTDRDRLSERGRKAIAGGVLPALRKMRDFFNSEYLPASFDKVGVWQMPRGDAFYAFRARRFTTTDMTPEQIHQKGLEEVARIRSEMERIRKEVGFEGTMPEFFVKLRTDPQFFYKTPDELFVAYEAISKRIDPHIVKIVKTPPRAPYGVVKIPDATAPDTTTAYYNGPATDGSRPGYYYVNLYRPETRPKWEMMALSLHEAVPGHHLQIARAQELGDIPKFRRYGGYTAYIEGWGLYAESLGDDMGLYTDPYSKFGQLTYEMWRAVRLVVDTGMHSMKWDRQKAIDYFKDNAAKAELDITNEIDRYITTPGQALAYKIGELKFKELRARAKRELGDGFDVRLFHDVILGSGALPLDLVERNVDVWIAQQKSGATGVTN